VQIGCACSGCRLVHEVHAATDGVQLTSWSQDHLEFIRRTLLDSGAVLFRNFQLPSLEAFESLVQTVAGELLEYKERSSPRERIQSRIYSSTEYPADQEIFFHNENSYQHQWPLHIAFYCVRAPEQYGATPLSAIREVTRQLAPETIRKFQEHGVLYQRTFWPGIGLSWQTVFQSSSRQSVEDYCRGAGITAEWIDGDTLRTTQVRPCMVAHPVTGEQIWFNHAAFFHTSTLAPAVRDVLHATYRGSELPHQTYYGDGSEIEDDVAASIRTAYRNASARFDWRRGDVLLLDNMLMAHAREPFRGDRKIVVAMAGVGKNGQQEQSA
jgi:alpha-ketoglutarate-dependent taurine dioxygenase